MKKFIVFIFLIAYCLLPVVIFSQNHTWHKVNGWTTGNPILHSLIDSNMYVSGMCSPQNMPLCTSPIGYLWKFNGTTWDSIGKPFFSGGIGGVDKFNNELYVAGSFPGVYTGMPWPNHLVPNTNTLAKYNGIQWEAVDSPMNNASAGTLKYKNDLYISGDGFPNCIGCNKIARYNGSSWNNMQGGLSNASGIGDFAIYNGDLIVAGNFQQAGNISVQNIAKWNGTQWDSLGSGICCGFAEIQDLVVDTVNNLLYATGYLFSSPSGNPEPCIKVWDGVTWSIPGNPPKAFETFGVYASELFEGSLYASSNDFSSPKDSLLWKWNGSTWEVVFGPTDNNVFSLRTYNGNLYVGGGVQTIDTTQVFGLACYGDSCPGTLINLTLPYSVHEYNTQLKFKVYPNPAKNNITIEIDLPAGQAGENKNFVVYITNPLGQKVSESRIVAGQKKTEIDVSSFGKGLFLVEVCLPLENEKRVICHTQKILIE